MLANGFKSPRSAPGSITRSATPTKKAQEILANQGRWVSRKDVKYQVDPGHCKHQMVSHARWGERAAELVRLYNRLIMRDAKPS